MYIACNQIGFDQEPEREFPNIHSTITNTPSFPRSVLFHFNTIARKISFGTIFKNFNYCNFLHNSMLFGNGIRYFGEKKNLTAYM